MVVHRSGQADAGIDRALHSALQAQLDDVLASGELWPGERAAYPTPIAAAEVHRPWQLPMSERRDPPGADHGLEKLSRDAVARARGRQTDEHVELAQSRKYDRTVDAVVSARTAYASDKQAALKDSDAKAKQFEWRDELTGIVVIHGIGPHLAGQTLLDWVRPIITVLDDARYANPSLVVPDVGARDVTDPVVKSNIDFSGETFPTIQVRVPRRNDVPAGDPRGLAHRWVFTEAWWASEIRPPTLATMIAWLGSQGGVGRIVQGIQVSMFGHGPLGWLGRVSLSPIVSVITSFVLLLFAVLLAISKLVPIGPLKDAVILRLAATFLTDWFGGARTILRDPSQSANVRTRIVMTIKALRAYGCRDVVIVAHSGGTMLSWMTLTDPAYEKLRVQKLVTIGEALNLGWRLNDANPDRPTGQNPTPPAGDRLGSDLATLQPTLQWRDFWATHDPAPSGSPPALPVDVTDPGLPRFSAERVYNRMAIGEDHGTYWDNDEHFLIPLIRELDVPTGDRGSSRFYSDDDESFVRKRRKERVGLLALWRRSLQALPLAAVLAAATVSFPGILWSAGDVVLGLAGLLPGHEFGASLGQAIIERLESVTTTGLALPDWIQPRDLANGFHTLGLWALISILLVLLIQSAVPTRVDRVWTDRFWPRIVVLGIDLAIGFGTILLVIAGYILVIGEDQRAVVLSRFPLAGVIAFVVVAAVLVLMGMAGEGLRTRLRRLEADDRLGARFLRDVLISLSSAVLGALLIGMVLAVVGIVVVLIRADSENALSSERFVLGAIAVLFVFRGLTKVGTWRWDSWDARERRALRRNPQRSPHRAWPYTLAVVLSVTALLATMLVAFGHDRFEWLTLGRDKWLGVLAIIVLLIVVVCLGKDTVDNDLDQGGGGGSSRRTEGTTTVPADPRPAAGSNAGIGG